MTLEARLYRALLRQLAELSAGRFVIKPPFDLTRSLEQVRQRFGDGHIEIASADRIQAAVRKLAGQGADALSNRERYVLAYGLSQPTSALEGGALINDSRLARDVLGRWVKDAQAGNLSGAIWRGLFRSFLQAPSGETTDILRRLLSSSLGGVVKHAKRAPLWLETIQRHKGLLGDFPCAPYVSELVVGIRDKLDDLVTAMAPPAPSWFWDALIDRWAVHIEQLSDSEFVRCIPLCLQLPSQPQLASRRDFVLSKVLDRHARATGRARHAELLAYSLSAWKSPQLRSSQLWSQVNPTTKRMVCGWLALEDLEDFYRLCQGDKQVDERRLKYWLRFKEQIGFSQIVLGQALFWGRDPDTLEFRERKRGRLAQLVGGSATNNAILMQIGDWVFVEFSETGNACYPYRADELPFEVGATNYHLHELKNLPAVERSKAWKLSHHHAWESSAFDTALAQWGVRPDQSVGETLRAGPRDLWEDAIKERPAEPSKASKSSIGRSAPGVGWEVELPPQLVLAIRTAGVEVEDLRPKGGCLWVYTMRWGRKLDVQLKANGFAYKVGRGFYRE